MKKIFDEINEKKNRKILKYRVVRLCHDVYVSIQKFAFKKLFIENLLMFLNKHFQRFYEIDQRMFNATRYAYRLSKIKLSKSNKKNEFLFKFNIVDDDNDAEIDFNNF